MFESIKVEKQIHITSIYDIQSIELVFSFKINYIQLKFHGRSNKGYKNKIGWMKHTLHSASGWSFYGT